MKILHVSYSCSGGGANIAGYNLHRAMVANGIKSHMYLFDGNCSDEYEFGPMGFNWGKVRRQLSRTCGRIYSPFAKLNSPVSFPIFPSRFSKFVNESDFDVVHLHWVGGAAISIFDLARINKPIFWTLHDLYPVQGIWHLPPSNKNPKYFDRYIYNYKKKYIFPFVKFFAPSELVKNIALQAGVPHSSVVVMKNIINPIHFTEFNNDDIEEWRLRFNISKNDFVILFVSDAWGVDQNKGIQDLIELINFYDKAFNEGKIKIKLKFVIVGLHFNSPVARTLKSLSVVSVGIVNSTFMRHIYSSSDLLLVLSKFETFGMASAEALVHGVPVLSTNVGAAKEFKKHTNNFEILETSSSSKILDHVEKIMKFSLRRSRKKNAKHNQNFFSTFDILEGVISEYEKSIYQNSNIHKA